MSSLRIVFMGTPDFAVTILDHMITNNYQVVGVITAPDKPAGRGRKLQQSAVKKYAVSKNLNILQPTNLKHTEFQKELENLHPDIQVVVAFRMLPKTVWNLPKHGTFNLHASLLPDYRGAAPIHWAIINGETVTGTTTFFLDDKIDTGEIILQNNTNIQPTETVGQLHDKLMHLGSDLVIQTLALIEKGEVSSIKQPNHSSKLAHKFTPEICKIDWALPTLNVYNKIRGLNPFPSAWTTLCNEDETLNAKIFDCEMQIESHELKPGTIIADKKNLKVATVDGFIKIHTIKLAGKKLLDIPSLLNGYVFGTDSKFK